MPKGLKELYEQGVSLYEKGNYAEAEQVLKQVLGINRGYADVLNMLGVICNLSGRLLDAASYLEKALALNPAYNEASLNLSVTYNELGETDKAYDVIMRAAEATTPSDGEIDTYAAGKLANEHFKLGKVYHGLGYLDEAIDEYRKALSRKPGLADIQTKLGVALREKGLYDEATTALTNAKEDNPSYGPARVELGLTYYMDGLTGSAFEEWESALENNPDLREARSLLNIFRDRK